MTKHWSDFIQKYRKDKDLNWRLEIFSWHFHTISLLWFLWITNEKTL